MSSRFSNAWILSKILSRVVLTHVNKLFYSISSVNSNLCLSTRLKALRCGVEGVMTLSNLLSVHFAWQQCT